MNMHKPMMRKTFDDINSRGHNACIETSQASRRVGAEEAHSKTVKKDENSIDDKGIVNTPVKGEGAWQKRGYSSLNSVVTVISHGKCVDVEVMSKKCRQCDIWDKKKTENPDAYEEWKQRHEGNYSINHKGSSGAMEVTGIN